MNKLLSFYNQNRRTIWLVILGIALFIAIIGALNNVSKINSEKRAENMKEQYNKQNASDYKVNPNISVTISNEEVNENKYLIIDQFIRYCNAGQIQNAYALLSNKCKEYLYPTMDGFNRNYINTIFSSVKLYGKEHYKERTYKINFYEDVAATGKLVTNSIEDYYTIVDEEDGSTKLNINNYIGDRQINSKTSNTNIEISVISKKIFKEYEEYTLEVKNLTEKEIMLDSFESTKKIYLSNNNNFKYYSMLHEKTNNELTILPKSTKKITLKFSIDYNMTNQADKMVISDIILDNSEYSKTINKSNYKNRDNISIKL